MDVADVHVLKEFNERKCAKMGKLLKEKEGCEARRHKQVYGADHIPLQEEEEEEDVDAGTLSQSSGVSYVMNMRMNRQLWRPALQSISEFGT